MKNEYFLKENTKQVDSNIVIYKLIIYISYFKDVSSITTIDLKSQPNSISGKDLKKKFKTMPNVQYQPSIIEAIKSINLKEGDLLLITGSLYGAAEVLSLN